MEPNRDAGRRPGLPETITAGGVTTDRIRHVLVNWVVRGICKDGEGRREAITYWGFVPGRNEMLRVVVSLDDQEIITAHFDKWAAERIEENHPWFQRRCRDLEVRDAG